MNVLTFIILMAITSIPGTLPDGASTLTQDEYFMAEQDPAIFPSKAQLLYSYSHSIVGSYFFIQSMQLYGDGVILITKLESINSSDKLEFYTVKEDEVMANVAKGLNKLGMFESKSGGKYLMDAIGVETEGYYLSLRIGEDYYSVMYNNYKGEGPAWFPLVEYIQSMMTEYMVEDNSVTGEEFLELLDTQLEIYGTHPCFSAAPIRKYVEKLKADE